MHRTRALVAGLALTLTVGACGTVGDIEIGGGGGGPTTTNPRPTTSTTSTTDPDRPDDPDAPGGGPGGSGGTDGCDEPPVWAFTATTARDPADPPPDRPEVPPPGGAPDRGCDDGAPTPVPTPEPELGTGDVQVTLRWDSAADIDLHVVEPDGTEIWYGDRGPTSTGGRLDVDSNVGCVQEASVENVFWPDGDMPVGGYRVVVTGFAVDGCGAGDYTVTASVRGETVLEQSGTVATDEQDEYTFTAG